MLTRVAAGVSSACALVREELLRRRRTSVLLEVRDVLTEEVDLVRCLDRFDAAGGEGSVSGQLQRYRPHGAQTHLRRRRMRSMTLLRTWRDSSLENDDAEAAASSGSSVKFPGERDDEIGATNPILSIQQLTTSPARPIPPRQCAKTECPRRV